jgi:hypothetical protein
VGCGKRSNASLTHCFFIAGNRQLTPQYQSRSMYNRSTLLSITAPSLCFVAFAILSIWGWHW